MQIAFESYHFRYFASLVRENRSTQHGGAFNQAVLYALLIHFRILLQFFYGVALQKDDCWVGHFRMLPEFDTAFPKVIHATPPWEREVRINLNKLLVSCPSDTYSIVRASL